jgi:hypothetical protein
MHTSLTISVPRGNRSEAHLVNRILQLAAMLNTTQGALEVSPPCLTVALPLPAGTEGMPMPETQHYEQPPEGDVFRDEVPLTQVESQGPETPATCEAHDAQFNGDAAINDLKVRMADFTPDQLKSSLARLDSPSPERAVLAYCSDKKVTIDKFEITDLDQDGMIYWAHKGLDNRAASPLGQQFTRAAKHIPKHMKDMYLVLFDDQKEQFRSAYNYNHNWDFVTEKRIKSVGYCKTNKQIGEYMNVVQLGNSYGGHEFAECRDDAELYIGWCENFGTPMVATDPVNGKPIYFRIKQLFEVSNTESWKKVTENSVTENVWESLAAECRAKRSFAHATGMGTPQMGGPILPHRPFSESSHRSCPFHMGQDR